MTDSVKSRMLKASFGSEKEKGYNIGLVRGKRDKRGHTNKNIEIEVDGEFPCQFRQLELLRSLTDCGGGCLKASTSSLLVVSLATRKFAIHCPFLNRTWLEDTIIWLSLKQQQVKAVK